MIQSRMRNRRSCKPDQFAYASSEKDLEKQSLSSTPSSAPLLPPNLGRGRIRFRRVRFQTPSSVSFLAHRVPGRELSEFLSAYYLCGQANWPSFSQNSPSLPPNPVSSLFRNSTFETVFCPFLDPEVWIWGGFFIWVRQILGKLPANFSANSHIEIVPQFFGLVSQGFQAPPKKFTPEIQAQNSRHFFPVSSHFWTQHFFTPIFCLQGRPTFPKI